MSKLRTKKNLVSVLALAVFAGGAGAYAVAQQVDEAKRDRAVLVAGGKYHGLAATLETSQWGWLDPREPLKLIVNSGDTVAVETLMHSHNKIQPGTTIEEIVALRKANPGGGPHTVTGPIYVNGAEPGDVMEIRILKIVPKAFGVNFNLPGKEFPTVGALAPEFPDGFVKYFYLDWEKHQAEFKSGIMIDLQPFPGIIAVGIDPNDPSPRNRDGTRRAGGAAYDSLKWRLTQIDERLNRVPHCKRNSAFTLRLDCRTRRSEAAAQTAVQTQSREGVTP